MNEIEEKIVHLAETCKEPDRFRHMLRKLFVTPTDNNGDFNFQVGTILYKHSYFALALKTWNHALKDFISNGDKMGEKECYTNLGLAHDNLGDFRKAIQYHRKALRIARETGDKEGESKCYTNLGIASNSLGNLNASMGYHERSLEIVKEIGDRAGEARCYANIGVAYHSLGDFRKAIGYHEKSLEMSRETGDRTVESACYANLGFAYSCLGDFRKAIEYHEKSLEISRETGDTTGESACYTNLGLAFDSLGDFRKAIEYHEKSLEISRKTGSRMRESGCYLNLGVSYHNLADFGKAIEYHEKALKINKEIGDRAGEARCYANIGVASDNFGDFKKAIQYHKKSLKIVREIGDRAGEARCYGNLGTSYRSLGDSWTAIKHHERSLEIVKEIGDRAGEARCYANIGVAYRNLSDANKAIECYGRSLEIAKDIGFKTAESACYRNLGVAYLSLGDRKNAIKYHEKSLKIDEGTGDIDSERTNNLNLGRIYYEFEPQLAYDYCKRSIELSEMIGEMLVEEEHKIGFYGQASDVYQYMIPLCIKMQRENEAFGYTERSKSRSFLDTLAATKIKPTIKLASEVEPLLDDEEKTLSKLREIQLRYLRQTKVPVEPGEVEKIRKHLNQIHQRIEEFDPEYVFARRGRPLSLDKIQHMLHSQKRDTVLMEYFVTKDMTHIFVVSSRNDKLHIETVPLSSEKLYRYLENYWREVVNHPNLKDISETWLHLSDYLIKPVSQHLSEGDLIYFVPHSLLHYLPMHALQLESEPLIKEHPVAYSPSASLIKFCRNKGSGKSESCASFGVASEGDGKDVAKLFEEEAEEVAGLFNTESKNGQLATRSKVRENCVDKDVIHFSCHGFFDDKDPLSSGVRLYDGVFTAREIFDLRLNAELVTLSACQTGLNERSPGDELIGLTRAFLYAGAPSVIVSLWSVDAHSTQELMLEFYKLLKSGLDKATALQRATTRIMEKEEWSHTYYWGPFILVGDWE
ncbi:MAG: CHAT domain-containing tetratricopeptide repeat protein [Candidatus Bathyarchaeota archaeon]|jgi:CHAT domain-containing protein/Tfp pilus assembly protein PilF